MVKASAQSPELVQMFDVAFSRRICCSRVERVSTKPRLPSASTVSPASRPGICRTYFSRAGEQADIGPAEIEADADRLAFADDDVGAHLAGRSDQRRARPARSPPRSAARRRRARASASADRSAMRPRMSGYWTTTQLVSPSIASISAAMSGSGVELRQRRGQRVAGEARHRPRDRDVMRVEARREDRLARRVIRRAMPIASQQAVEPSYIEALATSQP